MANPVNVPDVDGVPPVTFAPGSGGDIILAAADAAGIAVAFDGPMSRWGLYRQGRPVVICDTVLAFDHKADWAVSDHPLERGSFESFNKVAIPFDVRFIFAAGGSEASRTALLSSIQAIAGDLNLYDAVTPEKVYPSVNVVHYDYRRTAQAGAGLLVVAIWCQEIRQVTPSAASPNTSTAAPSGADPVNGGTVQPAPPGQVNDTSFGANGFASTFDPSNPGNTTGVPNGSFTNLPIPDTAIPAGPGGGGNVPQGEIALEPIDVPAGQ
ncbi:hypothetical protein DA075_35445 (plasmid) [Methylobacterium currus]|uniref:Uncharacterized protein n=1 Tax=Methylobacterium currus TaxID=2051553 RepID=A0A2R4WXA3_9HYPH|nr:hypothetical protein [Methylobacterium currus]AWB26168.1 hypothetical protein DA075_35445 [Methylobacterium currus]